MSYLWPLWLSAWVGQDVSHRYYGLVPCTHILTRKPTSLDPEKDWESRRLGPFLRNRNGFQNLSCSTGAYRNCLRQLYFKSKWRGIGYSFQLAITAPLYSITGYCIATAQSWSQAQLEESTTGYMTGTHLSCLMTLKTSLFVFHQWPLFGQWQSDILTRPAHAYLPGTEVNHDHEGGSSRVRPFHCTSVWLTPTIAPNVGNSSA